MSHLRQFGLAAALVLAVSLSAYAGDIECGGIVNPPPPAAAGDIECDGFTSTGNIECGGLTGITVSLIQSVLSLS